MDFKLSVEKKHRKLVVALAGPLWNGINHPYFTKKL